jgi:hypothetical protein
MSVQVRNHRGWYVIANGQYTGQYVQVGAPKFSRQVLPARAVGAPPIIRAAACAIVGAVAMMLGSQFIASLRAADERAAVIDFTRQVVCGGAHSTPIIRR